MTWDGALGYVEMKKILVKDIERARTRKRRMLGAGETQGGAGTDRVDDRLPRVFEVRPFPGKCDDLTVYLDLMVCSRRTCTPRGVRLSAMGRVQDRRERCRGEDMVRRVCGSNVICVLVQADSAGGRDYLTRVTEMRCISNSFAQDICELVEVADRDDVRSLKPPRFLACPLFAWPPPARPLFGPIWLTRRYDPASCERSASGQFHLHTLEYKVQAMVYRQKLSIVTAYTAVIVISHNVLLVDSHN